MSRSIRDMFALTDGLRQLREFSPATYFVERAFFFLQYLSPANLLFGTRKEAHDKGHDDAAFAAQAKIRGRMIDLYIFVWFLVLIICAFVARHDRETFSAWVIFLGLYRIYDIMQVSINLIIFDHLRVTRTHSVSSITRALLLGLWNFIELIICFGIVYAAILPSIENAFGWFDPYYFSAVTQLTIGYGDMKPMGFARGVAAIQGILGAFYIVLMISRFTSLMPRIKSIQPSDN